MPSFGIDLLRFSRTCSTVLARRHAHGHLSGGALVPLVMAGSDTFGRFMNVMNNHTIWFASKEMQAAIWTGCCLLCVAAVPDVQAPSTQILRCVVPVHKHIALSASLVLSGL